VYLILSRFLDCMHMELVPQVPAQPQQQRQQQDVVVDLMYDEHDDESSSAAMPII